MMTTAIDITQVNQWLNDVAPAAQLTIDSRCVQRGDVDRKSTRLNSSHT